MIKKLNIIFFSILAFSIIFESSEAFARKPKWVTNRPVDANYYIGIGKANKKTSEDYLQSAKNNALADLISEISVQISTNSLLYQIEGQNGLRETYEAKIKLAAKDDIEGFEVVDSWENKEEYWIYYRLSKSEYQRKKQEKLDRAKNLSKDFYEKAKASENEYDINNALIYYVKAFDAIQKHLGEDLSVFTFEGKISLDNAIYQSIQGIFSRIHFVPEKEKYTIKVLSSENEKIHIKVTFKTNLETQKISNIPVIFSFNNNTAEKTEKALSDNKGFADCTIAEMLPKGKNQKIKVELNTDAYFGDTNAENLLKLLFSKNDTKPYQYINVDVQEIFAYIEKEKIRDYSSSELMFFRFLEDELSKYFFSFTQTKQNADIKITVNSTFKEGEKIEKYNLYNVFLDFNISIENLKNNTEIYKEEITGIKGMKSGSLKAAEQDAMIKAEEKIKNTVIPNIQNIKL